jgi:hypothetical protein
MWRLYNSPIIEYGAAPERYLFICYTLSAQVSSVTWIGSFQPQHSMPLSQSVSQSVSQSASQSVSQSVS